MKTFKANPHQFGPGKIHYIDPSDESKTWCGRPLSGIPGRILELGKPTCLLYLERPERDRRNEERRRQYEAEQRQRDVARAAERQQYREWYHQYLASPAWREKRQRVMARAEGVCEGCGTARAVDVHHTTYANIGDELLWQLRAVCRACHEKCDRHGGE